MLASDKGGSATRLRNSGSSSVPLRAPQAPKTRRDRRPNLQVVPPQPIERGGVSPKIAAFLAREQPQTPCLVVDLDLVERNYIDLSEGLSPARIYYAVKANPEPSILRKLLRRGSNFDVASRGEIDICMGVGIPAERLSFGNTIKKQSDIAYAYAKGVRLFAFDSAEELDKLAEAAPGAQVFCRVLVSCDGAEWPLSRKFGCSPAMAADLLLAARERGLEPIGVSFHVGSQQTDLAQWDVVLAQVASLFRTVAERGLNLRLVNLGGGMPSRYRTEVPDVRAYGQAVIEAVRRAFPDQMPDLIVEPGRGMVGDAGVIEAEVVLVSTKDASDDKRWVYLDIGKFGGLAETLDESIKYRIETEHDGSETVPVILAGPTCDSADILYEKTHYELPKALRAGDKVRILACGAYTTTYCAVAFNGFPPLRAYCI
ncbi:MAG: type III PLP-dependent enzyme [Alphaproteobacteria bacterium]|nr:type III PLP-dependent enzyme [Alphaproteobacteria bacterium]TAD88760.1 MAG: type III PLP-dependent enzyme [Alphaproteobacteria bacterium]